MGRHRLVTAQYRVVVAEQAVDHRIPGVMLFYVTPSLRAQAPAAEVEQLAHRIGHRPWVVWCAQQAAAFVDYLRERASRHRDYRYAASHGFEDDQAKGFL